MIIGVPREIKDNEYRVAIVPSLVKALRDAGHRVLIETRAGEGSSISDEEFIQTGAEIIGTAEEVYKNSELVLKVKEPRPEEYRFFREGLTLFTFLHLAADGELAEELIKKGVTAIGYETVELEDRSLPILAPMSEVAGRLAVQAGAYYLMKTYGGKGVLLSGVPGVERGRIMIIGSGIVGVNAAKIALGLGAEVTMLDTRVERFRYLDDVFGSRIRTIISNTYNIEMAMRESDLLIGAVHIPGARTPQLVTRSMVPMMKKGSVIVDVSVDQGGCIETIRPTTHSNPVYEVEGIIHYGVANIPGAVPRTSTYALTNATAPYALLLAKLGFEGAVRSCLPLKKGVHVHKGKVTHLNVAESLGLEYSPLAL